MLWSSGADAHFVYPAFNLYNNSGLIFKYSLRVNISTWPGISIFATTGSYGINGSSISYWLELIINSLIAINLGT